jgi:putative phage-type endonuclease
VTDTASHLALIEGASAPMHVPIIHDHLIQRSPEWFAIRLGRLTSSAAADMLSTRKDKTEAAGRRNLRVRLALERITGAYRPTYQSDAMRIGAAREDDAVAAYEALRGVLVEPVGFVEHPDLMAGASPDGFVGADGMVEVKCPEAATHLEYLTTGTVPDEYAKQITHLLWITQRRWCDFVSYQPEFPEPIHLTIARVTLTEAQMASYALMARLFLDEVAALVERILLLRGG